MKLDEDSARLFPEALRPIAEAKLDEAASAHPDLTAALPRFVRFLAEKSKEAPLERLRSGDLFLAFLAGHGDAAAIRVFDESCLAVAEQLTPRFRKLRATPDEVRQLLREKLLLARTDGPPRILGYRGEGQLASWVRVTATRLLIELSESHEKEAPLEDELMRVLVDPQEGADIAHLKTTYRKELKDAFASGLSSLSFRERNLLRYSLLDHLSMEAIGGIYGVNKSTISRWIDAARGRLFDDARKAFQERLGVSNSEYESIVRLVMSHVDLSLARHLAPTDETDGNAK